MKQLRYNKNVGFDSFALSVSLVTPATPYQKWVNYSDSPFLTTDYPNQVCATEGTTRKIAMLPTGGYFYYDSGFIMMTTGKKMSYDHLDNGVWKKLIDWEGIFVLAEGTTLQECTVDIYTDINKTAIWKAKTT